MRLASLTLHRYGNYEAERICFDPQPGTVNILLAPNSAGKSVLRNAFGDLLFGIGNQTPMGFRFGYPGMRISAEIVCRDESRFAFNRRKVRGNIISDDDGQALDPGVLYGLLGGRDRSLLERLFVLDTEELRRGGEALLASGGDVASALLSAAGGIRQARALKQRLEKQRDELAPMRRTASRPFYLALDKFQDARRAARSETLLPEVWFRQERELQDLIAEQHTSNQAADTASAEIARLERIRRVRPALARHAAATGWLMSHTEAPNLAPDLQQTLTAARVDVVLQEEALRRARATLEEARSAAEAVVVDGDLLACAEPIEHLTDAAGAARKARDDLPGVGGQYEHGLNRIRDLLRQLGSPVPPDQADQVVPNTAVVARTRKLIDMHGEIAAAVQTSDAQIAVWQCDVATIEQRLAALPPAPDPRPLASLLETIRANGDPLVRLADVEQALLDAQNALHAATVRVPGWTGTPAALAAIAPLTMEIYARHANALTAAQRNVEAAQQRHDDAVANLAQARNVLAGIEHGGGIPDAAALAAARARRDDLWQQVYRRAFMGEPVPEVDAASGLILPLAFERAVVAADAMADRRYSESELLARVAAARQAVTEAARQADATEQRLRIDQETAGQIGRVWRQVCSPLPAGEGATLADVQSFLSSRERVLEAARHCELASQRRAAMVRRHAEWTCALAAQLGYAGSDLPTLLALADRTMLEMQELREARLRLETQKAQYAEQLQAANAVRLDQQTRLEAWRERWQAAMTELARPADEEPGVTGAVLEILREITGEHRSTNELAARIHGMHAVVEGFTQSVVELAHLLPCRTTVQDPFAAVRDLGRALNVQRELEERRRVLRTALDAAQSSAAAAEQRWLTARNRLQAVLDLIGAETTAEAEQRLALSAERTQYERQKHNAAMELHEFGDGLSIETLQQEADQVPADDVPARLAAATEAGKAANESAQRIAGEVVVIRERLQREAADTQVNLAAVEQQSAIASMCRTLDEALVYHTAAALLGRALEVIEQSGGSRMLLRLGAIFQILTGGAYSRVVTELDDGGTARLGLIQREFPDERQSVDQLSEGTRDQLFLALRVAAIEDHLTTAEPLPFIGDDILQTFDDDRALAALRVLTELSQHTQVIVLTHHRHIRDLAAQLPLGSVFDCRREKLAATV